MSTISEVIVCLSLVVIAAVHAARFVVWYRQADPDIDEGEGDPAALPRARRFPDVFMPLACGIATSHAGLTGPCCRRRNHPPPCLTDDAIEHLATHGAVTTIIPLAKPDEVEFGKTIA